MSDTIKLCLNSSLLSKIHAIDYAALGKRIQKVRVERREWKPIPGTGRAEYVVSETLKAPRNEVNAYEVLDTIMSEFTFIETSFSDCGVVGEDVARIILQELINRGDGALEFVPSLFAADKVKFVTKERK